jgi:hypothetical protein
MRNPADPRIAILGLSVAACGRSSSHDMSANTGRHFLPTSP